MQDRGSTVLKGTNFRNDFEYGKAYLYTLSGEISHSYYGLVLRGMHFIVLIFFFELTLTKLTPKQATQPQPPSGATFLGCFVVILPPLLALLLLLLPLQLF